MDSRSTGGAVTPKAICGDLCYEGASELAFALDDKVASGLIDTDLIVRVGPAAYADTLADDHVRPSDFTIRPMRGYGYVDATGCAAQAAVQYWAERAAVNIESLCALPSESLTPHKSRRANHRRG